VGQGNPLVAGMPLINSPAAPRFSSYRNLFGLHNGWIRGVNIPRHQSSLISFAPQSDLRWSTTLGTPDLASKVLADRAIVSPTSSAARCSQGPTPRPIGVTLDNAPSARHRHVQHGPRRPLAGDRIRAVGGHSLLSARSPRSPA